MNTFATPDMLSRFKEDIKGRQLCLLFYSASIDPHAKVYCIDITVEAFEMMLRHHNVKSFEADMDGVVVTIENIK